MFFCLFFCYPLVLLGVAFGLDSRRPGSAHAGPRASPGAASDEPPIETRMSDRSYYLPTEHGDRVFSVEAPRIKFGRGALAELGQDARALGMARVAVYTDPGSRSRNRWPGRLLRCSRRA